MSFELSDFDLDDAQREFRDILRRFFEDHAPITLVRSVVDSEAGISSDLWKRVCDELGLPGLAVSEVADGQGFGLPELGLALAETGRSLAPIPLFASAALAGRAIQNVAGDAGREWLAAIARGRIATLAFVEESGSWDPADTSAVAAPDGDGFRLSGEKCFVIDGGNAELLFVVARLPDTRSRDGLGLFVVDADEQGAHTTGVTSLDVTRKLSTLRLDGARARAVGTPGEAAAGLERALEEATVLLCAEMVGGMTKVLETAVEYAGTRYQFGRAIGSFQAIKHKCADMLIDLEGARTATSAAIAAAQTNDSERSVLASVAKAFTGRAYTRMTTENLQIHGGVGYTWEYDAHLYFRRAKSCEAMLGDAALHHERLAQALVEEKR